MTKYTHIYPGARMNLYARELNYVTDVHELALFLSISKRQARRLCEEGIVFAKKTGSGKWLVSVTSIKDVWEKMKIKEMSETG
jgi:hypothetical protein